MYNLYPDYNVKLTSINKIGGIAMCEKTGNIIKIIDEYHVAINLGKDFIKKICTFTYMTKIIL